MHQRFIAVEGPIGVGKSSLIDLLATRFNAVKVKEQIENPFLRDFYKEKPGAAFQAQLFFLLNRFNQQRELAQTDLFHQITLCDYLFAKDKIFAYLNLDDSELMLYERLYGLLVENVPRPDLVIYLQASTQVLVERIRKRHRDYEAEIAARYVEDLNQAYNYFFYHYTETPLLVINTTDIDFVENESDLEDLVAQIKNMGKGVQYYMPMSKR
ncbi:MAG TPA: deoxynucleoside kinase [Candidatus Polarisedimenticolia bacterium]|nr:deoxynucleoside kinase [Candidatus Polarisedimenticolia bacterium]